MIADPLSGLGVEIRGLDLTQTLAADQVDELRRMFRQRRLLLFRDVEFGEEDQLRLCGYLGPVVDPVTWVSNVRAGFHPEGRLAFHSDYAFTEHPMLGLSLYATELDADASPTVFASSEQAYGKLSRDLRLRLVGLKVVQVANTLGARDGEAVRLDDFGGDAAPRDRFPRLCRQAIWSHPVDSAPIVFVMEQQASHFEGWSCDESAALLRATFEVLYDPGNSYTHEWRVGDFVVWDNIAVQHGRPANPNTVRRSLRRVAINSVTTADLIAGTGFDPVWRAANLVG